MPGVVFVRVGLISSDEVKLTATETLQLPDWIKVYRRDGDTIQSSPKKTAIYEEKLWCRTGGVSSVGPRWLKGSDYGNIVQRKPPLLHYTCLRGLRLPGHPRALPRNHRAVAEVFWYPPLLPERQVGHTSASCTDAVQTCLLLSVSWGEQQVNVHPKRKKNTFGWKTASLEFHHTQHLSKSASLEATPQANTSISQSAGDVACC